jgi:hypothetical protein
VIRVCPALEQRRDLDWMHQERGIVDQTALSRVAGLGELERRLGQGQLACEAQSHVAILAEVHPSAVWRIAARVRAFHGARPAPTTIGPGCWSGDAPSRPWPHESTEVPMSEDHATHATDLKRWEYLVAPLKDAAGLKKNSDGLSPERLNQLGSDGWEAVGVSLKQGDLVAWPVVLLKRPIE